MKTTTTFSPEQSHTLQMLKFVNEKTAPIFAKAAPKLPEVKKRNESLDTIAFSVQRDFSDDTTEVIIEVLDYQPRNQGGHWDERLGPYIELGDAYYLDGRFCQLTELEREAAEMEAIKEIEGRPSLEEENLDLD